MTPYWDRPFYKMMRKLEIINEGYRLVPYLCPAGFRTVGIGFNLDSNKIPSLIRKHLPPSCKGYAGKFSPRSVETLFWYSLIMAENDLKLLWGHFYDNVEEVGRAVALDLSFNLGRHRLRAFQHGTLESILKGNFMQASERLLSNSRLLSQTGERYLRSAQMLKTGDWPPEILKVPDYSGPALPDIWHWPDSLHEVARLRRKNEGSSED